LCTIQHRGRGDSEVRSSYFQNFVTEILYLSTVICKGKFLDGKSIKVTLKDSPLAHPRVC